MASVLVTESIALRAASELKRRDEGRLRERFPSFFKNEEDAYERAMARRCAAEEVLGRIPGTHVTKLGETGLFSALWDLAEEEKSGLEVGASAIPILQETVELCEFCGVDPYAAPSEGALLAACPDAYEASWILREAGIPAVPIGILTGRKRRVVHFGARERFLDRTGERTRQKPEN